MFVALQFAMEDWGLNSYAFIINLCQEMVVTLWDRRKCIMEEGVIFRLCLVRGIENGFLMEEWKSEGIEKI